MGIDQPAGAAVTQPEPFTYENLRKRTLSGQYRHLARRLADAGPGSVQVDAVASMLETMAWFAGQSAGAQPAGESAVPLAAVSAEAVQFAADAIHARVCDPHKDHESDDVHGFPHQRICLTCSDGENEVGYFRRRREDYDCTDDDRHCAEAALDAAAPHLVSNDGCGPEVSDRVKAEIDAAVKLALVNGERIAELEVLHASAEGDLGVAIERNLELTVRAAALESALREAIEFAKTTELSITASVTIGSWELVLEGET